MKRSDNDIECKNLTESNIIEENAAVYGTRPYDEYTLKDYYALPEDQRAELIDGTFYNMASPGVTHQGISMNMSIQIGNYISKRGGSCRVFAGPIDVQLDCDDKTMLVPDIIVVCDQDKLKNDRIMGAPDFVAEIVSPSSRKRDYVIKTAKYSEAGVREYWIVDPEKERVLVYNFAGDSVPVMYGMNEKIPVEIFGGDLSLSFPDGI